MARYGDPESDFDDEPPTETNLILSKREAEALARVVSTQWINRDDMEAMDAVSRVCEFANPTAPIKPILTKSER